MKMYESSSSTSGSASFNEGEKRVSRDSMLAFVKLVYYEGKTLKQAANAMKIDYVSARRILKKFRNNTINVDDYDSRCKTLIKDLTPKESEIKYEKVVDTDAALKGMIEQMTLISNQLLSLTNQVRANQGCLNEFASVLAQKLIAH